MLIMHSQKYTYVSYEAYCAKSGLREEEEEVDTHLLWMGCIKS